MNHGDGEKWVSELIFVAQTKIRHREPGFKDCRMWSPSRAPDRACFKVRFDKGRATLKAINGTLRKCGRRGWFRVLCWAVFVKTHSNRPPSSPSRAAWAGGTPRVPVSAAARSTAGRAHLNSLRFTQDQPRSQATEGSGVLRLPRGRSRRGTLLLCGKFLRCWPGRWLRVYAGVPPGTELSQEVSRQPHHRKGRPREPQCTRGMHQGS